MKINYCLPIIKKAKSEVLEIIEKNLNEYQYFEVWLDPIEDLNDEFINDLIKRLNDQLILLFHRGNDTKTNLSHQQKLHVLDLLHDKNCFVDLDISEIEELSHLKNKKIKIKTIISYHNYQETPVDLMETIKQMEMFHVSIYKIATMCNNETDALKLLLLQQNLRNQNKKHIVLGMGEFGTITRVFGTLWGSELIYAPQTESEQSAQGQLTKKQLETIFEELNNN